MESPIDSDYGYSSEDWDDVYSSDSDAVEPDFASLSAQLARSQDRARTRRAMMSKQYSFPQFLKLAPEIQRKIWEVYCADLTARARILLFQSRNQEEGDTGIGTLQGHQSLSYQTKALRNLSAVHKASRDMVMRRYPDTLKIWKDAELLVNSSTDIFFFNFPFDADTFKHGLGENIEQIAIEVWENLSGYADLFPQLKVIYRSAEHEGRWLREIEWCGSPEVCSARIDPGMVPVSFGDFRSIYCWPGPSSSSCDYVSRANQRFRDEVEPEKWTAMEQRGIRLAPMIEFEIPYGRRNLTAMIKRFQVNRPRRDYYREDEIARMTQDPEERLRLVQQMKDRGMESHESESEEDESDDYDEERDVPGRTIDPSDQLREMGSGLRLPTRDGFDYDDYHGYNDYGISTRWRGV